MNLVVESSQSLNQQNENIYNDLGQQISQRNLGVHGQNYIQLDVRNYTVGNYLLMMEVDGKQVLKNFVVNR